MSHRSRVSTLRVVVGGVSAAVAVAGAGLPLFGVGVEPATLTAAVGLVGCLVPLLLRAPMEDRRAARTYGGLAARRWLGVLAGTTLLLAAVHAVVALLDGGGYGPIALAAGAALVAVALRTWIRRRYPAPGIDYG